MGKGIPSQNLKIKCNRQEALRTVHCAVLFFNPSFASLCYVALGSMNYAFVDLLPSVVIAAFSQEYLCGPWMYLEPNLWKSLRAEWDSWASLGERGVHAAPPGMLFVGLCQYSHVPWSFCYFHSVPHNSNPNGTSFPGELETGETYNYCQDIVSVARNCNQIRFKVSYWCDGCSACGLDWGGRLIFGLGFLNVSSVLITVASLVPVPFHVDADLLLFCWHFHDGLGVLANKKR